MEDFVKAGKITSQAREYAKTKIREGVNIYEFVRGVEDKIVSLGGRLAFPVNVSINEDAAHDTAEYEGKDVFLAGQVVKVDLGAQVNGFVGDTAFTAEISTKEYSDLINASEKALSEALKVIRTGTKLYEIGRVIEETIKGFGYNPIRNLGGHGVGQYDLHSELFIPNFDNGNKTELKENQMVAVEPFATTGEGRVVNSRTVKIYSLQKNKPVRTISARLLQDFVKKEFNTLPFAQHHLYSKFKPLEVRLGLRELLSAGALREYPVLTEASKGIVSQAEHTLLIREKPVITTL